MKVIKSFPNGFLILSFWQTILFALATKDAALH
jgi:hypothetical protein